MESAFQVAIRALRYHGLAAKIAKKAGKSSGFVSKVLNKKHLDFGFETVQVIKVAVAEVKRFEKDNGIGPGRPVQGE